jgi:hypothetical protein
VATDFTVFFTDLDQGSEILSKLSLPKSMKHTVEMAAGLKEIIKLNHKLHSTRRGAIVFRFVSKLFQGFSNVMMINCFTL